MKSRRMIMALLAPAMVVKRMTVSILLLILILSPFLSSSNSNTTNNSNPPYDLIEEIIFNSNFESNVGDNNWTVTSSSTDGNWVNDIPSPYVTGATQMEIDAIEGNQSLVTGSINNQDVDGGPTIVRSPIINLDSQAESIDIRFSYYFSHFINSSADDNLIISIHSASDNSELLRLVDELGASSSRDAQWELFEGSLLSLAGRAIYIQASSQDVSNPSKVEAAIDQLSISQQLNSDLCGTLIFDDFEGGFGNWIDGGSDATRIFNSNLASSGFISVRLRDNTNTSVITSGPYDLSDVERLRVSFHFVAVSFENDEDFWFQTSSDGVNFTIEEDWIHQVDFENNEPQLEELILEGPFSSTTYFRFRADATANGDQVYIDDVLIETCEEPDVPEIVTALSDTSVCNGSSITLQPEIDDPNGIIVSHEWIVLPSSTASEFDLTGTNSSSLSISAEDAIPGTIDLRYLVSDGNGVVGSADVTVFLLGVDPCVIETSVDTICNGTTLTLDATTRFDVFPDFGEVPASDSGEGISILHEIIGVQSPEGVLLTITLPTWDDHFDEIILNGNQIIPRVLQPQSWNEGGMRTDRPWLPNINGLPRSIITITSDEVRYFSALTVTSTEMVEVFPTNWVTTPQNFVVGTNTFHFGIQNTQGPTSGSWILEAIGIIGYSYLWSTGETTAMIEAAPQETTNYGVVITAPNGCVTSCDRTIYVDNPIVELSDDTISIGEIIQVEPTVTDNSGSLSYQWRVISDGNTGLILNNTETETLTVDGTEISTEGQEQVELVVTNSAGCNDIDTMTITVVESINSSCALVLNFFNEEQFSWGFGVQNSAAIDVDSWRVIISNATYEIDATQITNNNLFVHAQINNGDGTFDHTFTGSGGIPAFGSLPNFEWQGVNFGDPISSEGIEVECESESDLMDCDLIANFFNEQQFAWGFGVQNTTAEDIGSWQARISNANYELDPSQITNNNLFSYSQANNGDGTFDHTFTGTGGISAFSSLPNFEWQGVNFGGPISSDGIEFRCDVATGDPCAQFGTVVIEDTNICSGESIQIQPTIIGDIGLVPSYEWNLISDGSTGLELSNTSSEILTLNAAADVASGAELIRLVITNSIGCTTSDTMTVTIGMSAERTIEYVGCQGDGYGVIVNDVLYDEFNPSGVEIIPTALGCDSIINVDLVFNEPVVVEAGAIPFSVCSSTGLINLIDLGASITGGANTGLWTTMGDGSFDLQGVFNVSGSASTYLLGPTDIENGEVILTLTSTDPPGPCEPVADAVLVLISDITCSQFPWAGN